MNTIIGWLKFNENKDEECKECECTPCECDKSEEVDTKENEGISFEEFEAEYNALSIEEKRAIPEGFKKFLKKKGEGKSKKGDKKEDKEGGKPDFFKKKK